MANKMIDLLRVDVRRNNKLEKRIQEDTVMLGLVIIVAIVLVVAIFF